MADLSNNTVSRVATRMLRGVALVTQAESDYKFPSENWACPIKAWGEPFDQYYAEVWSSGMDWNVTYWMLEAVNFANPVCWPVLHFEKHKHREALHEFDILLEAILWIRRDKMWIKQGGLGIYSDAVWTYLKAVESGPRSSLPTNMIHVRMQHASQEPVTFWISDQVLPESRKP